MQDTTPIALQLYSVREAAKQDLHGVLKQVAGWGYNGVEFAGFHGHPAEQVKAWLDALGLACPSTHTSLELLGEGAFDQTVAFHQTIGCDTILIPSIPLEKRNSLASCGETAGFFLTLIEKLRAHGMRTGFHLHAEDVLVLEPPAGDGRSPWDVFAELTPEDFILQYDTANAMDGGADPVAAIRKNPGRSQLLHLKEFGDGRGSLRGRGGQGQAALGDGDVDWPGVLAAAQEVGGTQWYIIEQEGHPTLDEMDAAEQCLTGLKKILDS